MELKCLMEKAYYVRDTTPRNDFKASKKNDVAWPELHLNWSNASYLTRVFQCIALTLPKSG